MAVWYLLGSSTMSWSAGGMLLRLLDKHGSHIGLHGPTMPMYPLYHSISIYKMEKNGKIWKILENIGKLYMENWRRLKEPLGQQHPQLQRRGQALQPPGEVLVAMDWDGYRWIEYDWDWLSMHVIAMCSMCFTMFCDVLQTIFHFIVTECQR